MDRLVAAGAVIVLGLVIYAIVDLSRIVSAALVELIFGF